MESSDIPITPPSSPVEPSDSNKAAGALLNMATSCLPDPYNSTSFQVNCANLVVESLRTIMRTEIADRMVELKSVYTRPNMSTMSTDSDRAAYNLMDMAGSCVNDLNGNFESSFDSAKQAVESMRAIMRTEVAEGLGDIKLACDEIKSLSAQMVELKETIDKMSDHTQSCIDDLHNHNQVIKENDDKISQFTQNLVAVFIGMMLVMYINYFYAA